MDLRKFSVFIMILGLIIAGYGAYKIIALYTESEEAYIKFISPGQITNPDGSVSVLAITEDDEYKKKRNAFRDHYFEGRIALPIMISIAGGIILFIGIALRVSAKKTG